MRRKDRELTNLDEIIAIMKECDVIRLAFFDEEYPYIVPVNFGFTHKDEQIQIFLHGAKIGKKIELMNKNNRVAFEMDCNHNLITGENACDYTMEFKSVCGNGILSVVAEDEKLTALNHIMKQYTKEELPYKEHILQHTLVLCITVNVITGKYLTHK